jgi:hypothetical protein
MQYRVCYHSPVWCAFSNAASGLLLEGSHSDQSALASVELLSCHNESLLLFMIRRPSARPWPAGQLKRSDRRAACVMHASLTRARARPGWKWMKFQSDVLERNLTTQCACGCYSTGLLFPFLFVTPESHTFVHIRSIRNAPFRVRQGVKVHGMRGRGGPPQFTP